MSGTIDNQNNQNNMDDFNKRAREVFGPDVGNMLDAGEIMAGRLMDDMSQSCDIELNGMTKENIANQVINQREKRYLYGIWSSKFLAHPANRCPKKYDEYTYGFVPWVVIDA